MDGVTYPSRWRCLCAIARLASAQPMIPGYSSQNSFQSNMPSCRQKCEGGEEAHTGQSRSWQGAFQSDMPSCPQNMWGGRGSTRRSESELAGCLPVKHAQPSTKDVGWEGKQKHVSAGAGRVPSSQNMPSRRHTNTRAGKGRRGKEGKVERDGESAGEECEGGGGK
eukprot:178102-Chlamydomonas_euryale.AAC.1